MAKISRYNGNLQAFGSNSTGNYRTVFGDVTQSDTLDDNVNADYLSGWEIIGITEAPSKQDFNALGFTLGQLLAYLHQMGVAEYNASQEYHSDSVCSYDGTLYISLTDNNTGNTPDSSPSNWTDIMTSASMSALYYTKAQLDAGQLDNRYYTETEVDNLFTAHGADADPHSGYMLESNIGVGANNYLQLNGSSQIPAVSGALLTNINASNISSGTIDIDRLPQGALERLTIVADQTARYALTVNDVQNGDTVKQTDTGEMWYVKDDTNLNNSSGYEVYNAGSATSVPWAGITGKPDLFDGYVGGADNRVVRSDGAGGYTLQESLVTIDDSGNMSGVGTLSATSFSGSGASITGIDADNVVFDPTPDISSTDAQAAIEELYTYIDDNATDIYNHINAADPHPLYLLESAFTKAAIDALEVDAGTLDDHDSTYFATDSLTCHLAGSETVTGSKTFSNFTYFSNNKGIYWRNPGNTAWRAGIVLDGSDILKIGDVSVATNILGSGNLTFNSNTIYHAGNLTASVINALTDTHDDITATSEGVAASISTQTTFVTTNGDSDLDNVTLADGTEGQVKHIVCVAEGNAADTWKITPANMVGGTQITFSGVGDGCTLVMYSAGWVVSGNNGGTIS